MDTNTLTAGTGDKGQWRQQMHDALDVTTKPDGDFQTGKVTHVHGTNDGRTVRSMGIEPFIGDDGKAYVHVHGQLGTRSTHSLDEFKVGITGAACALDQIHSGSGVGGTQQL